MQSADKKAKLEEKAIRLEEKKRKLKSDVDGAISLMEKAEWKFSKARRVADVPGFVWKCKDKDGVRVTGKVRLDNTEVAFQIGNEYIRTNEEIGERFAKLLVSREMQWDIDDWRKRKREIRKEQEDIRNRSRHYQGGKCIYCGRTIVVGDVCDSCRQLYRKNRRGLGGYPSYDPNAQGSNLIKSDFKK